MIKVNDTKSSRINQGDIVSEVEFIEYITETEGIITVSKIIFPLVIVLTQDCDLKGDNDFRSKSDSNYHDKYLFSVIVAPLYNYEHFINGDHLSSLEQKMAKISPNPDKTDNKCLKQNETPRYHYLEFDKTIPVVNSVIDFKHYFTISVSKLQEHEKRYFVCSVSNLYRERISQRFSNYLSRIGLPTE